jgi:hypothetical protein
MRLYDRIRGLFGDASPAGRVLFIDDVTTEGTEILPAASADWCRRQMAALAGSGPPGDGGWETTRVLRPEPEAETLDALAIPAAEAARTLGTRLAPFDAVVTGDPNAPRPTVGIGFGPSSLSAVVIYAPGGSGLVSAVEVTLRGGASDNAAVLSAIGALPRKLIAVDWTRGRIAILDDAAEIARFVA